MCEAAPYARLQRHALRGAPRYCTATTQTASQEAPTSGNGWTLNLSSRLTAPDDGEQADTPTCGEQCVAPSRKRDCMPYSECQISVYAYVAIASPGASSF
eukprot:scaffold284300_cov30-Tisochrysis_lutea.AAC.8